MVDKAQYGKVCRLMIKQNEVMDRTYADSAMRQAAVFSSQVVFNLR